MNFVTPLSNAINTIHNMQADPLVFIFIQMFYDPELLLVQKDKWLDNAT